ncbi:ATPase [Halovibrio salipaludis]|uniref:ATPase n=1 Tax=Halovibrio salipaludis TaxID=2032626 RepID=A0A2A2EXK0_9GAMM|nr:ATPase [Halovibrio salipaludis]PAU77023.1 ATPase [Halovibrio salipaludis]
MELKTFKDLIDWTRTLHHHMATCLAHCASEHQEERARILLDYLATHEAELEKLVTAFERESDVKALKTWIYDFLSHKPIETHRTCDLPYTHMGFDDICREIFDFHDQIIDLYQNLQDRAEIPEAREMVENLLNLERHEAMRIAREVGRMQDV